MRHRILGKLQQTLGRHPAVVRSCVKLRNQLDAVIAAHLAPTADAAANGEYRLVERLGPACERFVDVGANVGGWSRHFLAHSRATGVLFEPSAQACRRLSAALDPSRVTVRGAAVGERVGEVLFVEEDGCGETSAVAEAHAAGGPPARRVEMTTLDHEFAGDGRRIDFLKIDAEGYDLKVLTGAGGLLAAGRVRFVQFEYNTFWAATSSTLSAALRLLHERGFQVRRVSRDGLAPVEYDLWGEYFRYSNYFAFREADTAAVGGLDGGGRGRR